MCDYVLNAASVAEPYPELASARVDLAALLRGLALLDSDSDVLPSLRLNVDPWLHPLVSEEGATPITLGELAQGFYGTADHDLAEFFELLEPLRSDGLRSRRRFDRCDPAPRARQSGAWI